MIDVGKLPRKTLKAGTHLYRIHRLSNDPWFFDGSPNGRFNPSGTTGRGACYWAEHPLGAWIEVFRTRMLIPEGELGARVLSAATLNEDLVVRDLSNRRALRAGVTVAVTGGADYGPGQRLADALQGGAAGIRWRVRHDLAQTLIGIAWFGPEGVATRATRRRLPRTDTKEIPDNLVSEATKTFGYELLPLPPA
jgi:hypothetical protein